MRRLRRALAVLLAIAPLAACGAPDSGTPAAALFATRCASCHGADGRGDRRRLALHPNLDLVASPLVRKDAGLVIYRRIADGYGAMPGFSTELPRGDLERLVAYVKKLAGR